MIFSFFIVEGSCKTSVLLVMLQDHFADQFGIQSKINFCWPTAIHFLTLRPKLKTPKLHKIHVRQFFEHNFHTLRWYTRYHSGFFGHFETSSRGILKKLKQFSPKNSSKFVNNSIICQLKTKIFLHLFSFGKIFQKYCPKTRFFH